MNGIHWVSICTPEIFYHKFHDITSGKAHEMDSFWISVFIFSLTESDKNLRRIWILAAFCGVRQSDLFDIRDLKCQGGSDFDCAASPKNIRAKMKSLRPY